MTKISEIQSLLSRAKSPINKIKRLTQSNQTRSRSVVLFQGKSFLIFTALPPSLTILEFWTKVVPSIRKILRKKKDPTKKPPK